LRAVVANLGRTGNSPSTSIGEAYVAALTGIWAEGSLRSARRIVPMVTEMLTPTSVIDVGCGIGAWLVAFAEAGVADYLGVDGEYVRRSDLLIPQERFEAADLEHGFASDRCFDLAVSLEVAEHLRAESAPTYVSSLVALAPAILFSAAVPGQGGIGHVNEQWPPYWGRLFAAHGYQPTDPLRSAIWNDADVEIWYRQNLLLYLDPELYERVGDGRPDDALRPVVHPDLSSRQCELTLRQLLALLPAAARESIRYHVSRHLHRLS
jgi:SAM-dependent methyltransferase